MPSRPSCLATSTLRRSCRSPSRARLLKSPRRKRNSGRELTGRSDYSEKLNVGYRWYDSTGSQPLFPFGFGLSYTTFKLGHFAVKPAGSGVTVKLDVTNTGKRQGAEVVQVYVGHPAANGEPPHQLRAFAKVQLKPGETKPVTVTIDSDSFSTYDSEAHKWVHRPGTYQILAGTSSRDLPLQSSIAIP